MKDIVLGHKIERDEPRYQPYHGNTHHGQVLSVSGLSFLIKVRKFSSFYENCCINAGSRIKMANFLHLVLASLFEKG